MKSIFYDRAYAITYRRLTAIEDFIGSGWSDREDTAVHLFTMLQTQQAVFITLLFLYLNIVDLRPLLNGGGGEVGLVIAVLFVLEVNLWYFKKRVCVTTILLDYSENGKKYRPNIDLFLGYYYVATLVASYVMLSDNVLGYG